MTVGDHLEDTGAPAFQRHDSPAPLPPTDRIDFTGRHAGGTRLRRPRNHPADSAVDRGSLASHGKLLAYPSRRAAAGRPTPRRPIRRGVGSRPETFSTPRGT